MIATEPDMRVEMQRRKSQRQRLLKLLTEHPNGWATNVSLQRIACNYTMRVSELRKDGHKIQAVYDRPGLYRYFYKGKSD